MNRAWVEPFWLILIPAGAFLWALGGTGPKWARRYVYPALLGLILFLGGIVWWRWLSIALGTSAMAHLGYGDAVGWGRRWLVGLAYACSLLPVAPGFSILIPLSAVLPVSFMWASRRWNALPWKLCELGIGGWHSAMVCWFVTH